MAEELKHLLERIQKEGVDKAETQAEKILADARGKARQIISDAEAEAKALTERAEAEAEAFAQRGAQSLRHAARDVILSVGDTITRLMESLVRRETESALSGSTLNDIVVAVVRTYCAGATGQQTVTLLVSPEQQETLRAIVMSKLDEALSQGVEILADDSVASGFRVSVKGQHVEHDFTAEAIADALCALLRPHLAEIVKTASAEPSTQA